MAIALVNIGYTYNSGASTTVASPARSHTTGNLLVVIVAYAFTGGQVNSIADTAGNTYTYITREQDTSGNIEIWYAKNITGNANNIITATLDDSRDHRFIAVHQYSGMHADPYDSSNTGNGTGTALTTASAATSYMDEVIVAGYYTAGSRTFTAGSGFTTQTDDTYFATEDRIINGTGSYGSSATISDSIGWGGVHATFRSVAFLSIGSGSFTITGSDVALTKILKISAESGAISITGSDVELYEKAVAIAETITMTDTEYFRKSIITVDLYGTITRIISIDSKINY